MVSTLAPYREVDKIEVDNPAVEIGSVHKAGYFADRPRIYSRFVPKRYTKCCLCSNRGAIGGPRRRPVTLCLPNRRHCRQENNWKRQGR
jgi:hypothetical protein